MSDVLLLSLACWHRECGSFIYLSEKYELVSMKLLYELVLTAASRAGSHEFGIPSIQLESKIKITQIPRDKGVFFNLFIYHA